jgi:hypothetical protein
LFFVFTVIIISAGVDQQIGKHKMYRGNIR